MGMNIFSCDLVCCSITSLPVILKGILTAPDALLSVKYGATAIIVSNHGARQIDGTHATVRLWFFFHFFFLSLELSRNTPRYFIDFRLKYCQRLYKRSAIKSKYIWMAVLPRELTFLNH